MTAADSPATSWPRAVVGSMGQLEGVQACDDGLLLSGWVASNAGPITGFEATALGRGWPLGDVELRIESPDLPRFFPPLEDAGRARFRAVLQASAPERETLRDRLIALTPLVEGKAGAGLLNVYDSRLPRPGREQLAAVGAPNLNVGFEFLDHFVQLAGLRPDEDVLDVGCGVGRMAIPLVYYLDADARYEGFDVVEEYVDLARQLTGGQPRFGFRTLDVANTHYNPSGSVTADRLAFPYDDASFDFAFLASVFTHLRADGVRHYLDELRRVLRPGGRCLISAFLLDEEAHRLIEAGQSLRRPIHPQGECFVENPDVPETAVAYPSSSLLGWAEERGFKCIGQYPGLWCGRSRFSSFQDMMVLECA